MLLDLDDDIDFSKKPQDGDPVKPFKSLLEESLANIKGNNTKLIEVIAPNKFQ